MWVIELFFAVSSYPLPWNSSEGRNLFIHYNYNSSTGELDTQVYINNFKVIWNFRQRYIEQTTPLTKIHYIPVLLNKLQKVEGNFKRFLISSLSSASWQLMAIQEIQFHLAIKSYFFVIPIGICGHFALLYVEYTIELAK